MPIRLLHTADLHLDRAFGALPPDVARLRRRALRERLTALLALARQRGVDAMTIGGDLYDQETAAADLEPFLRDAFAAAAPLPIFIAPGNHDPYQPDAVYRRGDWPANVHVFRSAAWEGFSLGPELELWGTAFVGPERTDNPFRGAPPPSDRLRLALVHGEAALSGEPSGVYAPFGPADPAAAGFALALLGHIHQPPAARAGDAPAWIYPGSPEPLDFGETGPRGAVLVAIDPAARRVQLERLPLATVQYLTATLDLEGRVGSAALLAAVRAAASARPDWQGHILRLRLQGHAALVDCGDVGAALREVTGALAATLDDQTQPPWDADTLARERTIRGAYVRRMLQRLALPDADRPLLYQALSDGLDALAGVPLTVA